MMGSTLLTGSEGQVLVEVSHQLVGISLVNIGEVMNGINTLYGKAIRAKGPHHYP